MNPYLNPTLLVFFLFLFLSCAKDIEIKPEDDCIDKSQIDSEAACYLIYAPVCGCDGKTYSNDCIATNSGVVRFENGECN